MPEELAPYIDGSKEVPVKTYFLGARGGWQQHQQPSLSHLSCHNHQPYAPGDAHPSLLSARISNSSGNLQLGCDGLPQQQQPPAAHACASSHTSITAHMLVPDGRIR